MADRFSSEQVVQIIRVARIMATGFTKEQFQSLVDSQEQLSDAGFCEAVWAVVRLHQEKGTNYNEVVKAIDKDIHCKAQLESKVNNLEEKLNRLQIATRQAEEKLQQLSREIQKDKEAVQELETQRQNEEEKIKAVLGEAQKQNERTNKELHQKKPNLFLKYF